MNIKKNIPNAITCCNLLCGCLALIQVFNGTLVNAAWLVGAALLFDFFDGFVARLLNVSSPIGKDLDSLADMVTFGVVPGMVMFKLIGETAFVYDAPATEGWTIYPPQSAMDTPFIAYIALIIPLFSCIRLAKFNNDKRQSDSFIGLPTPSNALVICSFPLILEYQKEHFTFLASPWLLIIVCIVFSLMLVAELPLFALKFKGFGLDDKLNRLRYIFLALVVVLLLLFKFAGIPLAILLYILISIVNNIFLKKEV